MFDFLDPWLGSTILLLALLVVGFVLLIVGADWLVDGASGLAKRFHVSNLVIGLTVVAFGTSMPEFVVNMVSVSEGTTDLAMTNILGSNIINVFIILGLTAIVFPVSSQMQSRRRDIPLACLAGVAVLLCSLDGRMSWIDGLILLIVFCGYMCLTLRDAKQGVGEEDTYRPMSVLKAMVLILVGLAGLVVGGEMIVKGAVKMASDLGVGDAIIGLTVVALGTSLPELATSIIAAAKKNSDLALGNVVGSNIFNAFFVLGVSAVVHPLPTYKGFVLDSVMAALGALLVWIFVCTDKEKKVKRWAGATLVLVYAGYLTYRIMQVSGGLHVCAQGL